MYNPVPALPYARPSRNRAIGFLKRLRAAGANAHLRESRGLSRPTPPAGSYGGARR